MGSFSRSLALQGVGRATRGLNTELLCVLGVQSLPAVEVHGISADDASNRLARKEPLKDVEADVPARSAPRDEAAIDVVPEREARAAAERRQFPPEVAATPAIFEQRRRLGLLHGALGDLRRRRPGRRELHRTHDGQVPISVKRRPFGQVCRIGQRLPHDRRRVTELSDKDERPLLSVLLYVRPAGGTRCILLAIAHLARVFLFVRLD
jgi:hypothetical protein